MNKFLKEFLWSHDVFRYEDLLEALGYPVEIWFDATVVGYGDEYTSCVYELTNKGWKVNSADLYVWNEDEGEYQIP